MKDFIKNFLPWLITAGVLLFLFLVPKKQGTEVDSIKTDTIYKTIVIPEKTGTFNISQPTPIYISQPQNDKQIEWLYEKMNELQDDNQKLNYLLSQLSTKLYDKTYEDKDVSITVSDSVSGKLLNQSVKWKVKPQEIQVKEIHTTEKLKPKFTISAGFGVASQYSLNATPTANAFFGLKNKKGYELILGIDTKKTYQLGLKKDLFTKY